MPAAESSLQNPIIIQKILNHRSPDSMDNLNLRLINKSFNSAVIHQVRTTHRSIRIEVPGALDYRLLGEAAKPVKIGMIHVNKHCVMTERIFDYLGFLKEVAKVKVKHLVMINIWATVTREEWRKDLHVTIGSVTFRHYANWPLCHLATEAIFATSHLATSHSATMPFRHCARSPPAISRPAISPLCRFATMPTRHYAISPLRHFATVPFRNCAISPLCQFTTVPFRHHVSLRF